MKFIKFDNAIRPVTYDTYFWIKKLNSENVIYFVVTFSYCPTRDHMHGYHIADEMYETFEEADKRLDELLILLNEMH